MITDHLYERYVPLPPRLMLAFAPQSEALQVQPRTAWDLRQMLSELIFDS